MGTEVQRLPVFLDPGHGGADSGAVANGIVEKLYVTYFANALYWILHDTHWIRPHVSRAGDENLTLDQAAEIGAKVGAKFALAIHVNANKSPAVGGMMSFFLPGDNVGGRVAAEMQRHAPTELKRRSLSPVMATAKSWPRVVNVLEPYRKRNIGAALIELGFATNENDALFLQTPLVRHQLLGAVLSGLEQLRYVFGE